MTNLIQLVTLAGLPAKELAQRTFDIRSRDARGELRFALQADEGPQRVHLTSVEWKNSEGRRMLYWRWQPAVSRRTDIEDYSGVSHNIASEYYLEELR